MGNLWRGVGSFALVAVIASLPGTLGVSPAHASARIGVPKGTKVELEDGAGGALKLKPEEQVAFLFAHDLKTIQAEVCHPNLARLCSLKEALQGGKDWSGAVLSFTQDPMLDPDYEYLVTSPDGPIEKAKILHIAATPRRAGLGGFLFVSRRGSYGALKLFFNPAGAASPADREIPGYGFRGDSFLKRTE